MFNIFRICVISFLFIKVGFVYSDDKVVRSPLYVKQEKHFSTSNFNWKGTIRCVFSNHVKTKKCDLEFTREDGKVFTIMQNKKLVNLHCKKHKDLQMNIKGLVKEDFLLHVGILYVKDFQVIKKISDKSKQRVINITKAK